METFLFGQPVKSINKYEHKHLYSPQKEFIFPKEEKTKNQTKV